MKRLLFAACIVVALPVVALAQTGQIGLFADPGGNGCTVTDNSPGPITVYVVLTDHGGAGACDFMVQPGPGFLGSWVSDTWIFATTQGTSDKGISIIFGSCEPTPTHVLTINYVGAGTSSPCSSIDVVGNTNVTPPSPSITSCVGSKNPVPVRSVVVNPDVTCNCIVPVEETTWGRIKALYHGD
ncbi:MAG: hypothetical protein V3V49_00765 [Candidatus Krumholzibacteria bacterium]